MRKGLFEGEIAQLRRSQGPIPVKPGTGSLRLVCIASNLIGTCGLGLSVVSFWMPGQNRSFTFGTSAVCAIFLTWLAVSGYALVQLKRLEAYARSLAQDAAAQAQRSSKGGGARELRN